MLRDYLKIEADDQLIKNGTVSLKNRGQEDVTEWTIVNPHGVKKGGVTLFDKLSTRRSWCVGYRITQTDLHGNVVVDKLTDAL
ncbi:MULTISPECIES: hypothetical protein [Pantoea]|jgi:hypothetical protein|uniref:Uncharacterized protein n=1 Tax=Pantoea brenneri TaxID=472694 RepID=A0A653ZU61_9GAMM|nr:MULTISPECIES: hypothetical protein [Pantoea]KKD32957.1 hypothetical protein EP46_03270 [Pantoea sp. 3.5.1]MBS6035771.1 hypothetical protein [Pantoea sp.]MBZ6396133.1 hypothetical protein [Pantoea sp.]MBZ6439374.1 hypothetical protein [Pantoea sp.]MCQ5470291.1 hypothetical protein [Pantoea brenneri]